MGPLLSVVTRQRMVMQSGQPFDKDDVAFLTELIEAGAVRPVIDRRYPLSEVPEALRFQADGHPVGKLVITL